MTGTMVGTLTSLRLAALGMAMMLVGACGGGVTTYAVSITVGADGSVSPTSATVNGGGTSSFTITPNGGYVASVTGCGGTLSGNTYTTGPIHSDCTVTANFAAAFTWVAGPDTGSGTGIYGVQGVAAMTNVPGARYSPAAWTGTGGSLWLFGGEGLDSTGVSGDLNDLWQYSPSSGEWTWVGGSDTTGASGVYGTEGVAAAANVPGARHDAATWTGPGGDLWLFGGWSGSGGANYRWNDLWKYSTSSGEWTWVDGADTANAKGVYGTQGVAAATNVPGARTAAATWVDASGNLWLFGGEGIDSTGTYGWLNDLWEYSPASGEWTWVGGSDTVNTTGTYGTQGVAAASNVPGARAYSAAWTDSGGNLWLFGGVEYDYASASFLYFNDLWKYSPSSGEWTWVDGSDTVNAKGVYGTQGVAAPTNVPGARDAAAAWTDASGNLWLFGGYWQAASGAQPRWNDLWKYSPSSGEWTWVAGSNTPNATGIYGAEGVAAATDVPGARDITAAWTGASGNLWLFGGVGYDATGTLVTLSDLWKYPTR